MFRPKHITWVGAIAFALTVTACSVDAPTTSTPTEDPAPIVRDGDLIPGQYIVAFNDYAVAQKGEDLQALSHNERLALVRDAALDLATSHGLKADAIKTVWGSAVHGVLMKIDDAQADKLRNDPHVRYIEQDRWVSLPPFQVLDKDDADDAESVARKGGGGGTQPAQTTPWGITRVGGAEVPSSSVTAWIIDSGIDLDHPDLNVVTSKCRTWVTGTSSADDGNGHGSHVAGTVGAKNNTIGVIGVAPGINLVALRVLNSNGSGEFSWSISAFDHVAANGAAGDVVNYSVGPGSRYTLLSLDNAVANVGSKGIKVAMAAGNSNDDCTYYSPARLNATNVFTIAAMTSSNAKASYSNFGAPVDYWEPGSSVYSTYKGGGYATLSGTSMASPHGCGILAVGGFASGGTVSGVPAGTTTTWGKRD